jgi:hypothetical protein
MLAVFTRNIERYGSWLGDWWAIHGAVVVVCLVAVSIVVTIYLLYRHLPAAGTITWLALLAVFVWASLGDPVGCLAAWLWPGGPAPWESVDAIYYPDKANRFAAMEHPGFRDIADCRAWVSSVAASRRDPGLRRGYYECAVGHRYPDRLNIYRLSLR